VSEHSSEVPASTDWVALLSGVIVAFSATVMTLVENSEVGLDVRNVTVPGPTLLDTAILATLTWIAVALRFPFLSVLAAIGIAFPKSRPFAENAVIICSLSLLARTRFFGQHKGERTERFAGAASGWLTTLAVLLFLRAHANWGHSLPPRSVAFATLVAALCFAILSRFKARRTAGTSADRMPTAGSFMASFFAGAASLVLGMVLVLAAVVMSSLSDIGNSGSSAPGAWQSQPQLQASAAPPLTRAAVTTRSSWGHSE